MPAPIPRRLPGVFWFAVAGAVLIVAHGGSVSAQVDQDLQGRLMQRSDGALFIYKDGLKYPVQLADVDDDVINSIPEADPPIVHLDQLFMSPTPVPLTTQLPPTPADIPVVA